MTLLNIALWCFYALAFGCIVAFASQRYETYIHRRQRKQSSRSIVKITVQTSRGRDKVNPTVVETAPIRGYDTGELFREDLWLRRLAGNRQKLAPMELAIVSGSSRGHAKQLYAMLVQHAGATSNN